MKPNGLVFDSIWRKKCTVLPVPHALATPMIQKHYLAKWPGVCVLKLGLFCSENLVGVIIFALPPRETAKRYGGVVWELACLWLEDSIPANGETWLISQAIKFIRCNHPKVFALVSYADPSVGHAGTIYRAANWTFDGKTDQGRKTPRFDYRDAFTGKHYSRRKHVPSTARIERVPRVSKHRFFYRLKKHPSFLE